MSLEERSRARLKELEEGREKFISDAQRQIAGLDAAIAEIKALLDPPAPAPVASATGLNGSADEAIPVEVTDAPRTANTRPR